MMDLIGHLTKYNVKEVSAANILTPLEIADLSIIFFSSIFFSILLFSFQIKLSSISRAVYAIGGRRHLLSVGLID